MHALIIEDEVMIAATIEYVLRQCGFDTFDVGPVKRERDRGSICPATRLITADVQLNWVRHRCGMRDLARTRPSGDLHHRQRDRKCAGGLSNQFCHQEAVSRANADLRGSGGSSG